MPSHPLGDTHFPENDPASEQEKNQIVPVVFAQFVRRVSWMHMLGFRFCIFTQQDACIPPCLQKLGPDQKRLAVW
jgi:hypothetical protein